MGSFFSGIGKLFDGMHPLLNCLFSLDTDNPNKLSEIFGVSLFLFGSLVLFRFFFKDFVFSTPSTKAQKHQRRGNGEVVSPKEPGRLCQGSVCYVLQGGHIHEI